VALPRVSLGGLSKTLRIWLLLIPIFAIACLVYFLVLRPKAKDIEKTQKAIRQVQSEIGVEQQLLASFAPLSNEERGRIQVTGRSISSIMEAMGEVNKIYDDLTNRAKFCNIPDISVDPNYTPTEAKELPIYDDLEAEISLIKITFHSSFESLGCFLKDIDQNKDILLESLTIARTLPKPKTEMILRVFAEKQDRPE